MIQDIKWEYWKTTDQSETIKIMHTMKKIYLIPGIEEVVKKEMTPTSDP